MFLRLFGCASVFVWLLPLLFHLPASVSAKDDVPKVYPRHYDTRPFDIRYFEDSEVVLVALAQEQQGNIERSEDGGKNWSDIPDIPHGEVASLWMNPYHGERAVVLGRNKKHWITEDKGKTWRDFKIPEDRYVPALYRLPLSFHASDPGKMILKVQEDKRFGYKEQAYYTTNGFKDIHLLKEDTRECLWVKGTPESKFPVDDKSFKDRVLCIVGGDLSGAPEENKVLMSDDYFVEPKAVKEPVTLHGRKIKGFVNMAVIKGYIVAAAKAEGSTELSLMVSGDGESWHQGVFQQEHEIHEEAYTVLESSNYSIQVDVLNTRPGSAMGVLFSSDSNGTYFTENIRHTNRNLFGMADFERITGIQGTMIVNVVKNWEEVERSPGIEKELRSQITFDDGKEWHDMKDRDGKPVHLHSITDIVNSGKVFSSPAPGLVMGVGNTGDHLHPYVDGDLWISDNAGRTWTKAPFGGAHKYEFGDQGTILVAIDSVHSTKEIKYSTDYGDTWTPYKFTDADVRADILTTVPDSTTQKFTLTGISRVDGKMAYSIYTFDFTGIYGDKKCGEGDFEEWSAPDADGKDSCVMGHKQIFSRRKKDAKCLVGKTFKEAIPKLESCTCTYKDYECDFGYVPRGQGEARTCEPTSPPKNLSECKKGTDTFESPSGFRLIPGSKCKDGVKKDQEKVNRPCDGGKQPDTPLGQVGTTITTFPGSSFKQKVYLEREPKQGEQRTGDDETVVMSVARSSGSVTRMYYSRDHGKSWKPPFRGDENFQIIMRHQYDNDRVFFISPNSRTVAYSVNRMESIDSFTVPQLMNPEITPLVFHQEKPEYLIWTSAERCPGPDCHSVAHFSENRGGDGKWSVLARYVRNCEFIERNAGGTTNGLIYCEQKEGESTSGKLQLRATADLGASFETKASDILAFATMSEFIIVAQKDPKSNLRLTTSVDGQIFADAKFPHDFNVPVQNAYTVLDSSTHAIFLHVTTSSIAGFEYGRLVKSNSNGTFYVTSLDYVNRDSKGFVDFEKMHGVDGVAMVNVVANPEDADLGKAKKLRTLISHNDGAQWAPIEPPADNTEGEPWTCNTSDLKKCSLHLHSYTERDDAKHTFSSASAVGLMVAVGNVGEYLADINDKDNTYTFISGDAGKSWKVAKKGRFLWEYGDQGSLVVLVEQGATNFGYYTLDEGQNWTRFAFGTKSKVSVLDLTTMPSDNSKQFIVWFRNEDEVGTINLDFTPTKSDRYCVSDEEHHGEDDYYLWTPEHPQQLDGCLFGQKMQYIRKKPTADCWNGERLERLHGTPTPCDCARQDFEW